MGVPVANAHATGLSRCCNGHVEITHQRGHKFFAASEHLNARKIACPRVPLTVVRRGISPQLHTLYLHWEGGSEVIAPTALALRSFTLTLQGDVMTGTELERDALARLDRLLDG